MSLKDYIQGKRKGKNANRLEREALNDPFLQDALEGFDAIQGDHLDTIEKLEKEIVEKGTRRKTVAFRRWQLAAAAACITLLLGIGSLFLLEGEFNNTSPGVVQSEPFVVSDTISETGKDITDTTIIPVQDNDTIAPLMPEQKTEGNTAIAVITRDATQTPDAPVAVQTIKDAPSISNVAQSLDGMSIAVSDTLPDIEIVGVGYGTMTRERLAGAVASVGDSNKGSLTSAEQLLQGKIAGLSVVEGTGDPTKGSAMRLRGGTSLSGSNSPLVVVDGVAGVDMNTIPTSDIVSIDVLKDASAAAIYGSRGANGVIIVTTTRNGAPKENYFGKKEFLKYIDNSISKDICTDTKAVLHVNIYIDKNGVPTVSKIKESTCKELEDEFIRLLKNSPNWTLTEVNWNIKIKL